MSLHYYSCMTKIVNIHEAKTNLSKLLADLENNGGTVIICRYGKPIAEISPKTTTKHPNRLRKHPVLSKVKIYGDITQPLNKEDWGDLI